MKTAEAENQGQLQMQPAAALEELGPGDQHQDGKDPGRQHGRGQNDPEDAFLASLPDFALGRPHRGFAVIGEIARQHEQPRHPEDHERNVPGLDPVIASAFEPIHQAAFRKQGQPAALPQPGQVGSGAVP